MTGIAFVPGPGWIISGMYYTWVLLVYPYKMTTGGINFGTTIFSRLTYAKLLYIIGVPWRERRDPTALTPMKKLLQFMLCKASWFYDQKTSAIDPDVYALSFLICVLSCSGLRAKRVPADQPGIIMFIIGWRAHMRNDNYKEWI